MQLTRKGWRLGGFPSVRPSRGGMRRRQRRLEWLWRRGRMSWHRTPGDYSGSGTVEQGSGGRRRGKTVEGQRPATNSSGQSRSLGTTCSNLFQPIFLKALNVFVLISKYIWTNGIHPPTNMLSSQENLGTTCLILFSTEYFCRNVFVLISNIFA